MEESFFTYRSKEVQIGNCPLGGSHPIRLQSMTNTNTMDTRATVEQCIRIFEKGAHYVRIATPTVAAAQNLEHIKKELLSAGFNQPLVADIHFNPEVALTAARLIEKIRINPGNYADKNTGNPKNYTQAEYESELERIAQRIEPLLKVCKEYGTAIRIGTNHGSLSERIMSRYGDTPEGIVEASMEFLRICQNQGFNSIVVSLKTSNPVVMVKATRLLAMRMQAEGMNFPLHLGVTEAGNAEEARIKSAMGIASLLAYGIGDTIRVSLTEDPELEIPVAAEIARQFPRLPLVPDTTNKLASIPGFFTDFEKQEVPQVSKLGGNQACAVIAASLKEDLRQNFPIFSPPDFLFAPGLASAKNHTQICPAEIFNENNKPQNLIPYFETERLLNEEHASQELNLVYIENPFVISEKTVEFIQHHPSAFVLDCNQNLPLLQQGFMNLRDQYPNIPIIIRHKADGDTEDARLISAASIPGAMLMDGLGEGLWLDLPSENILESNKLAFMILQASRRRITQTEFIACPSCARTNFDIQGVLQQVKLRTSHLKGLKIAVMGCVVNGPGEMADADYGYIGIGGGKVNLYRKKQLVLKGIFDHQALDRLIEIINADGLWKEPETEA